MLQILRLLRNGNILIFKSNVSKFIKNFEFIYENIIKLSLIITKNINIIDDKDEIE